MRQRLIIAAGLAGVCLLSAGLGGCHSSQPSLSPDEAKSFKGSAPPAGMAQSMQQAQQEWQKRHPGMVTTPPGVPAPPGPPAGGSQPPGGKQ